MVPTQAQLDACVACGLCLPHCPTFRLTGDEVASPRGRVVAMGAVATGEIPSDDVYAGMLSFCLGCRACEAACPSLIPFGLMLEGSREQLARGDSSVEGKMRRLLVGRVLNMRWMLKMATLGIALLQRFRVVGLLPKRLRSIRGLRRQRLIASRSVQPAGDGSGSIALLTGCVMNEWFPEVHEATRGVLETAGFTVDAPPGQQCCGALAAHEGAGDAARRMAERNVAAFSGYDIVVADAAGCSAHLKEYGEWAEGGESVAGRTRDITEFVAELIADDKLPRSEETRGQVAVHDPCHLRHAQRIVAAPREIVRAAGYEPVEIDPDGLCCGAAGLYMVYQYETADQLGERKKSEIKATGTRLVVSANPGCEIQLRSHLDGDYTVLHPVELYWQSVR